MRRGEVYWADLGPPSYRRPVLVLTRSSAIDVFDRVVVAPLTRTIRGIASEVSLGPEEGLAEDCVASCDNVLTVPKVVLDEQPIGKVEPSKVQLLDQALRFALEIQF